MVELKFDVVIVSAGTGGCSEGFFTGKGGLRVSIVGGSLKEIGVKVCGDAISKRHFDQIGIPYPPKGVLMGNVKGIMLYSPDLAVKLKTEESRVIGFYVDRYKFRQYLLKTAINTGVDVIDNILVKEPIIEKEKSYWCES